MMKWIDESLKFLYLLLTEKRQGNLALSTELITLVSHCKEFQSWRFELWPFALKRGWRPTQHHSFFRNFPPLEKRLVLLKFYFLNFHIHIQAFYTFHFSPEFSERSKLLWLLKKILLMMMTKTIIIIIMIIVIITREPNSLRWFLAGPSNYMLGNRVWFLTSFYVLLNFIFILFWLFWAFANIQILRARKKGSLSAS